MRILKQFVLSLSIVGVMAAAGLPQPTHAEVQQRLAAASPSPRPAATSAAEARIENTPRQQESRLSDPLEKIAALARAASGKDIYGRTKPGNRPGAGDWNDALEIAKQIDAEVGRLANVDLDLEQDFADELAEVERRNLAPEMKQRLREAQQTIRQRLHDFRQITNRLNAAVRSGRSDEARAQVDALAEFLAKFDTARGAGPVDPASIRAVLTKPTARQPAEDGKSLQARLDTATGKSVAGDGVSKAAGPTAADLGESDEVQLTPAIRALAAELGNSPTRIVEWVTNNIEYLPTYGAIQGAQLTLTTRRGNAFDTNALLVALLRAANVPARFVYGTVEIPEAQVRNWVGNATSPLQAADVLTKGGIPTTILNSGGKPAAFRIEHVWVEAYVDYVPSRGAVNREGDTWVPLDASFKQYTYADPIDYVRGANVPAEQILTATFQTAERGPLGSITGIDFDYLDQQIEGRMDSMTAYVQSVKPDANLDDILGRKTIVQTSLPMLAGTLPYRTVATTNRYAALPNGLKHYFEVSMFANPTDVAYDSPAFTHRIATVKLDQAPVYVKYAPATVTDEQGLAGYAEDNAASLPLSMFRVVPELHIGDAVVQRGGSTAMGTMHYWTAKMIDPSGASSQLIEPYRYAAGSHIAFVPNLQGITSGALAAKVDPLPKPSTMLPVHQALDLAGNQYWFLHDLNDRIAAAGWKGLGVRMPSVGAFAAPMNVRYFFGLPRTGYFNGYSADVKSVRLAASHTDQTKAARMVAQMGSSGSFAEGLTWDLLFGTPAGDGISAASIIAWANTAGVPIHTITRDNIAQVMPVLKLSADAKSEISDAVAAGFLVVAPEEEYRSRGWSGSGYVLMDPASGGAIYRVEGGLNGGIKVGCIARAIVLKILCSTRLVALLTAIAARIALRFGIVAAAAAVFAPVAPFVGIVLAVWTTVEILMAVYEVQKWVNEIINGITGLTPEEMAQVGIDAANEALCNYMPICFGSPFISVPVDMLGDWVSDTVNDWFDEGGADGGGAGNPIGIGSGTKYQTEVDYVGSGPFPLTLTRRYVSYLPNGSIFGHKWRGNYDAMIRLAPDTDPFARPDAVLALRRDGALIQFNYRSGRYVANGDVSDSLERLVNGSDQTTGWRYRNQLDEIETYDEEGKLLSVQQRSGLKHVLSYNEKDQLVSVADDFGRALRFTYDGTTGQVRTVTDPAGQVYSYEHNASGSLTKVTYPGGKTRQYHYEVPGRESLLSGITDERGIRYVSWKYDSRNRAIESSLAGGVDTYRLAFGDNTTTVIDPRGAKRVYTFQRVYDTLRMTGTSRNCTSCGSGGASAFTYDGNGYPTSIKDFNGNLHTARFNARGLPETITMAANSPTDAQTITFKWHPTWRLPAEVVEPAASGGQLVRAFEYNANGTLKARSITADGKTRTWRYTYNAHSQVTSIDGPRSDVNDTELFGYDATTGVLSEWTNSIGLSTAVTAHDPHGRISQTRDPNGLVTDYTYDERGWLTKIARRHDNNAPEVTVVNYDGSGLMTKATFPDGSVLSYEYDDARRLTGIRDALGNSITYVLAPSGDRTRIETADPEGVVKISSLTVDLLGRIESVSGGGAGETRSFTYDANGNVLTALVPEHAEPSRNTFDALNRLKSSSDPTGAALEYTYDKQNNLRAVKDSRGVVTSYGFTGFNELSSAASPDAGTITYGYDDAGNTIALRTTAEDAVTLRYDGAGRLLEAKYPDETVEFRYDEAEGGAGAKGRLTSVVDSSGLTSLEHDAFGRVTRKTQQLGTLASGSKSIAHRYSATGKLAFTTLPSGAVIGYEYAIDGGISAIRVNDVVVLSEIEFFPFGEPKRWTHAGGVTYTREFDEDGRIVSYTRGNTRDSLDYDNAGRVVGLRGEAGGQSDWAFDYDQVDRLTTAENRASAGALANHKFGFAYDASGNRVSSSLAAGDARTETSYAIDVASNRLTGVQGYVRSYDGRGNTTTSGSEARRYSGRGKLIEVLGAGGVVATYSYNGFGERVCKAVGGGRCPAGSSAGTNFVEYLYGEGGRLVGEYDATGALIAEHVWVGTTPVLTLRPASDGAVHGGEVAGGVAVYFVHPDNVDSPRSVLNGSGQVVWQWSADPFGVAAAEQNPAGMGDFAYGLRFPGQYFDAETGLHYNYYRYYEPSTGRYLESDPVGLRAGPNTYAYVWNSPLDLTDPLGLGPKPKKTVPGCGMTRPGKHAGDGIPVSGGHGAKPTPEEQEQINKGRCHACGTDDPGTKSGDMIGDHQPPTKLSGPDTPQCFYPHCWACARRQGGIVRGILAGWILCD